RTIQRYRICQPSARLTVSYCRLLASDIHGLNCVRTSRRKSRVMNDPPGRSTSLYSVESCAYRPGRGRSVRLRLNSARLPSQKSPKEYSTLVDAIRLLAPL